MDKINKVKIKAKINKVKIKVKIKINKIYHPKKVIINHLSNIKNLPKIIQINKNQFSSYNNKLIKNSYHNKIYKKNKIHNNKKVMT
jgi:hypothetical protein